MTKLGTAEKSLLATVARFEISVHKSATEKAIILQDPAGNEVVRHSNLPLSYNGPLWTDAITSALTFEVGSYEMAFLVDWAMDARGISFIKWCIEKVYPNNALKYLEHAGISYFCSNPKVHDALIEAILNYADDKVVVKL